MAYMTWWRRTRPTSVDRPAKRRIVIDGPAIPMEPRWGAREWVAARELGLANLPWKGGCLGGSPGKRVKPQFGGDPGAGNLAALRGGAAGQLPRGLVGLTNQEDNCYANTIVQMLYLCRMYASLLVHIYIWEY